MKDKLFILRELLGKTVLITIGLAIAAFGIAITYKTGIGTSPMATAIDGLTEIIPVNHGQGSIIMNVIFLIVAIVVKRKKINVGTILVVFTMGIYINLFGDLIEAGNLYTNYQFVFNFIGTVITAFGIAMIVKTDFGLGPLEIMTEVIKDKLSWSYRISKISFDVMLLITGIMMGGVYGIGTISNVLLVGVFIQVFLELFNKKLKMI